LLNGFGNKIVIHTESGKTEVKNKTLYTHSKEETHSNKLDYTDEKKIIKLHKMNKKEAIKNLILIKRYLSN